MSAAVARRVPALTALELACGIVFNSRTQLTPPPLPAASVAPQPALDGAIRAALQRPPCLVSFSGGRDSSLVLAAATRLARREGLGLPVPATNRFAGAPAADETGWQERVVAHLGLDDWLRVEIGDELDAVGPYAQRVLREHGVLWPFNIHFHLPLLDRAGGGSLLTGVGGDELFDAATRPRVAAVLAGAVRPQPRDAIRIAFGLAPAGVRRRVLARRRPIDLPWLAPAAGRAASAAAAAQEAAEPRGLAARLSYWRRARYLDVALSGLDRVAAAGDVRLVHPLCAEPLWSAVARAGAPRGFADQSRALGALFGELLPADVLGRAGKASFNEAFWLGHSRAFAASWDGGGVPQELVDVAALRAHWGGEAPILHSFSLLQSAWLAADQE